MLQRGNTNKSLFMVSTFKFPISLTNIPPHSPLELIQLFSITVKTNWHLKLNYFTSFDHVIHEVYL